ncbi:MAG: response regulator [Deltaproteobacteria bacterium]|nr:response regulator [Deltaproteobacteria bacterium]
MITIKAKINVTICLLISLVFVSLTLSGVASISIAIRDTSNELLFELLKKNVQKLQSTVEILQNVGLFDSKEHVANAKQEMIEDFRQFKYKNTGIIYVLDSAGKVVFHAGMKPGSRFIALPHFRDIIQNDLRQVSYLSRHGVKEIGTFYYFKDWDWLLCLEMSEEEIFRERTVFIRRTIIIAAIEFIIALAIGPTLSLSISKRLNRIVKIAQDVTAGKDDIKWLSESHDEIGVLNSSLKIMTDNLKGAEKKYRSIYENAVEGIFQTTPDGVLISANPALAGILGYDSSEELIASLTNVHRQMYVHAQDRREVQKGIDEKGQVVGLELEFYKRDGQIIWCTLSAGPIYSETGELLRYEGTILDVTEKKEKERAEREREAAEAATRTKSEFLANMSHEVRTPMNAIIGFSSLALKTELSGKQRDYLTKIEYSAKSLLGIINDILDFSKIEAGRLEMEAVDFQLDNVMADMGNMISVKAAEKGLELVVHKASDVPNTLIGDPLRLGQILVNLANNAAKFTQSGHILIKAELLENDEEYSTLKFSVADSGIGMTPEQIEKLFTAFSQVDTSVTRKFGGTGLGLAISKKLVEMMGGSISVESEPGRGSTFSFTARFKNSTCTQCLVAPTDLKGLKVLVVDDNEAAREVLCDMLTSFGFTTTTVESGRAALDELERASNSKPYDLVFMDWKMPGMDGITTSQQIKQDFKIPQVPLIIMITAFGREEVIKRAGKAGINDFLMKPVSPSLLFDTIMGVFGREISTVIQPKLEPERQSEVREDIEGAKVLLVEDNALNQQVATEILESVGLIVDVCNNGKEAVDAVVGTNYDLVLMDVQMPVMGGYEATRLVRQKDRFKKLPIIAMTAHAMKGAKEECLAAGMNDYVSKPIDPAELFTVLARWIQPGIRRGVEETKKGLDQRRKQGEMVELPAHLPGVDLAAGVERLQGNTRLYRQLLQDFADKYISVTEEIKTLLIGGDLETAERLAHTVRGIAGNISAKDAHAAAEQLETAIKTKQTEQYDRLILNLDLALKPLAEAIMSLKQPDDTPPPISEGPVDLESVTPILIELAQLIQDDNTYAENTLESLRDILGRATLAEEMGQLEECLQNYDFEGAQGRLQKIVAILGVSLTEVTSG